MNVWVVYCYTRGVYNFTTKGWETYYAPVTVGVYDTRENALAAFDGENYYMEEYTMNENGGLEKTEG